MLEENKYLVMLNLNEEDLEKLSKKYEGDDVIMEYKDTVTNLNKSNKFESFLTYEQDRKFWLNTERNKGIKEGQLKEKKLLAKNMLKDGVEVDKIAKYTNLSKSNIINLM